MSQKFGHAVVQLDSRSAHGNFKAIAHSLRVKVAEREVVFLEREDKSDT